MKIVYTVEGFDATRKKLAALPVGIQADVIGDGLYAAARKAASKSKRLAPVGKGLARTSKGKPRRRLRDSIKAHRVSWRWGGEKVPRSASIVVAEQPHAHLVERGTVRMKARPFLEPPMRQGSVLMEAVRAGTTRSFTRLVKRLEAGKLRARERRAFR